MSPEIDRMLELDAKATPGPWINDDGRVRAVGAFGTWTLFKPEIAPNDDCPEYVKTNSNIVFAAEARNLAPNLARATKIALTALEDVESRLIGYGHSEEERQNNPLMKALAEMRREIAS